MDQRAESTPVDQRFPPYKKPSRRSKLLGGAIALAAIAGLGALAWHLTRQDGPTGGQRAGGRPNIPTTVGVATVQRAEIPVLIDALGTVTPSATVTVRPQVGGVLQKVLYQEGQMVKAGQVLAQIDPRPFEMALMQATGQRQRDEAQLDNARITLQRFRTLLAQDSIARQEVDTQAALVKQLEAAIVTDKAAEGTARLNLGYSKIVAPISGRVGLRVVDIGNVVGANDANGVAVITQVAPIDVEFTIPQDQVPAVQASLAEGVPLQVTALDRTRSTVLETGKFLALDNQVDVQTGTVKAKGRFANAKLNLFPSQFVNVQLLQRTIRDALVVPVTALRHGGNGDFVYVLNEAEKTVALRQVKAGQATVEKIQIVDGLKEGEKVITEGADRLKDGAKVTLPGDKPAGAPGERGRRRDVAASRDAAGGKEAGASRDSSAPSGEAGQEQRQRRRRQEGTAPAQ